MAMTSPRTFDHAVLSSALDTPALALDLDVLIANLTEMRAICDAAGVELLPHAKTHRVSEIGRLQIERGADGLCVAKLGEAESFAVAGVERLVVAYPLAGREKVNRALELSREVDLTVATDSLAGAAAIGDLFSAAGQQAQLYLIIDSGLGRVGVQPESAVGIARAIARLPGVLLTGIMTHEGTVYEAVDPTDLHRRSVAAAELMVRTAEAIRAAGVQLRHVSMGASASARVVAGVPGVTQIRPGIFAFNDLGQIGLGNATAETCAIRVVATVVSNPEPARACLDAGAKALGQDLMPGLALRHRYPGHGLIQNLTGWQIERLSEEHGWLRWNGEGTPSELKIGQRVTIIPNHACTAFFCLGKVYGFRAGELVETWETLDAGSSR